MFEEDFEAERKSRAAAVGKMNDLRREYRERVEEMEKELTASKAAREHMAQLFTVKQEEFQAHLEDLEREHRDYQEKMESEVVAKASQVQQYHMQVMAFEEQVKQLAMQAKAVPIAINSGPGTI